jgi:AbiV family abortive infection protein
MKERDRQLSIPELRDAYHAALTQSQSLQSEGQLLLENKRFAGAFHRFVIALEEIGKARITMYQASFVAAKSIVDWRRYWRSYYSHMEKLRSALLWHETPTLLEADSPDALEKAFKVVDERASDMDRRKQEASYSGPNGITFAPTDEDIHEGHAQALAKVTNELMCRIQEHKVTKAVAASFEEELLQIYRFTNTLGYLDPDTKDLFEALNKAKIPFRVRDGHLPTDEEFLERVQERYSEFPPRLKVTLPTLNRSEQFMAFYEGLKWKCGYPDWIFLGVVFNLALNARVDIERLEPAARLRLLAWSEDPSKDQPLDVSVFTDSERFNFALDAWTVAFLSGLGIVPEPPVGELRRVRHLAAR